MFAICLKPDSEELDWLLASDSKHEFCQINSVHNNFYVRRMVSLHWRFISDQIWSQYLVWTNVICCTDMKLFPDAIGQSWFHLFTNVQRSSSLTTSLVSTLRALSSSHCPTTCTWVKLGNPNWLKTWVQVLKVVSLSMRHFNKLAACWGDDPGVWPHRRLETAGTESTSFPWSLRVRANEGSSFSLLVVVKTEDERVVFFSFFLFI